MHLYLMQLDFHFRKRRLSKPLMKFLVSCSIWSCFDANDNRRKCETSAVEHLSFLFIPKV